MGRRPRAAIVICETNQNPGSSQRTIASSISASVASAEEQEAALVRQRIETALRGDGGWRLISVHPRPVADAESTLAGRLLAGPRAG